MTKTLTEANGLDYKYIDAEQFDAFENSSDDDGDFGHDARDKALGKMQKPIGYIFLRFSAVEHDMEICISDLFSDRSSHTGMQVNKFLEFSDKVSLLSEMLTTHIRVYGHEDYVAKVKGLTRQLSKIAELRNIVAHAKWFSLTEDGFVRSQVKLNKETGMMHVKYYKIDIEVLKQIALEIESAEIMLSELVYELEIG